MATTDNSRFEPSRFIIDTLAGITIGYDGPHTLEYSRFLTGFRRDPNGPDEFLHHDPLGTPLTITRSWFEAPDRQRRAPSYAIAWALGATLVEPDEIWVFERTLDDGRSEPARFYIGEADCYDVAVEVRATGWNFASSRDGIDVDTYRIGERVWIAPRRPDDRRQPD